MLDREREEFDLLSRGVALLLEDYRERKGREAASQRSQAVNRGLSIARERTIARLDTAVERACDILNEMRRRGMDVGE